MTSWATACLDWRERLLSGRSLVPDLPLYEDEAERALRIFKRLRVPDMVGAPQIGAVAGDWLYPIVRAIFGSLNPETNERAISEFFWLVPKKNTKSSSASAIMVEALILNRRPEAEFVLVSPTKEISDIAFRQAAGTIRADAELAKLFHIQTNIRRITHRRSGATLQVKAADTDVITGGKQVGTLIDELHVLSAKSHAAEIMVELRGALAARPDGFLITITTQSKKPPAGIFKTELAKARDVRDGKLVLPLLPILYELPADLAQNDGWKNRKYWPLVNPNLGRSVSEDFLANELASKEREGAGELALFASQHFNVEIGQSLNANGWVGALFWVNAAEEGGLTLDELLERSEVVVVGLDGGGSDDLFGFAALGRERGTRRWLLWTHAWAQRPALEERRKALMPQLVDYERDGDLELYSMDTNGKNVKRLTNEPGYDGGAFFSPDSKMIVYRGSHPTDPKLIQRDKDYLKEHLIVPMVFEVWVMNADGSNKRQVTNLGVASFAPYFTPDGKRIIFCTNYFATDPKPGQQSVIGRSLSTVFGTWIAWIG